MNNKAVSEVVGALMVIAIIATTAGIVYVIANPFLSSSKENVKCRKALFDALELKEKIDNVKSGLQFNSTYTLRIAGASFSFENLPVMYINNKSTEISSIKIAGNGWELYYEDGAVIESRYGYSKMLHFPSIYYDSETNTLTMPVIKFTGKKSAGGQGYLTINFRLENVSVEEYNDAVVSIQTLNAEAWKKFFDKIGLPTTLSSDSVEFNVSKLVITIYEVGIE